MTTHTKPSGMTPWVEKYRPQNLNDVSHQNEVIATLQNAVKTNRLPHLLFYGPPGTGKTSVALALCKTLWAPDQYKRRVLELNASDERGISVVRDKVKAFAGLAIGNSSGAGGGGLFEKRNKGDEDEENKKTYPNPPFKIIILDEADTVTRDAQAALRRVIEAHSRVTRFILICNYVTRIIEPLASRCAKFRFQPLPPSSMKNRLDFIAQAENVQFSPNKKEKDAVIDEILVLSNGDMRRAVTTLQSAHSLTLPGECIEKDAIAEMAGLPPRSLILDLFNLLKSKASLFDEIIMSVQDIVASGYSAQHVITALSKELITCEDEEVNDMVKANIAIRMAEVDKNLVDGADEMLQLMTVCSLMTRLMKQNA